MAENADKAMAEYAVRCFEYLAKRLRGELEPPPPGADAAAQEGLRHFIRCCATKLFPDDVVRAKVAEAQRENEAAFPALAAHHTYEHQTIWSYSCANHPDCDATKTVVLHTDTRLVKVLYPVDHVPGCPSLDPPA